MNARNRMADVVKLRCNVCQEFFRLVLPDKWQQTVYQKAKEAVENNCYNKNNYVATYERMRAIGIDNYRIEDMDVTIMLELIHSCSEVITVKKQTKDAMRALKEDRNSKDHSGENEEDEEIYLNGLLSLCRLEKFVKTIDRFENNIDEDVRSAYLRKYFLEIQNLKNILDEERIALVQRIKNMDKDIQRIQNSVEPNREWQIIIKNYTDRYHLIDKTPELWMEFEVRASDAGVSFAHEGAASYFAIIKKDFAEAERRLFMVYNAFKTCKDATYEMKSIVDTINYCLANGCQGRNGFMELINEINQIGYTVVQTDNGFYELKSRRRK